MNNVSAQFFRFSFSFFIFGGFLLYIFLFLNQCKFFKPSEPEPPAAVISGQPGGDSGSSVFSIMVDSLNTNEMAIVGVGGSEIGEITFILKDSANQIITGSPVIHFSALCPGGVEKSCSLITPSAIAQDGRVTARVKSGTLAGSVLLIAVYLQGDDTVAISETVRLTVNGGLPVDSNFTLSIEKLNFAAYRVAGKEMAITVFAFDRFHNPVVNGHAVYLTSNGGGISPHLLMEEGRASALFTSTESVPVGQIIRVKASTQTIVKQAGGSDSVRVPFEISDTASFVLSGATFISVTISTISVAPNGSAVFTVTVGDAAGFGLEGGSTVAFSASAGVLEGPSFEFSNSINSRAVLTATLYNTPTDSGPVIFSVLVGSPNNFLPGAVKGADTTVFFQ